MKPILIIIAAIGKNRELGKDNKLLFDISEDKMHFREVTRGHPVIMGRKTAEHLVEFYTKGPLPGRKNIVVTRNPDYTLDGFIIVPTITAAIQKASEFDKGKIFVIGGGEIYNLALPYADQLDLTIVDQEADADAFFPDYSEFKKVISERKSSDDTYTYRFVTLKR